MCISLRMSALLQDTLIMSDLHLGSELSRASMALRVLQEQSFTRLMLLGDIFCDLNFRRLKKEHWKFLSYIRKLSNPKRKIEVVWVEGNHDQGLTEVMSHLVGVRAYQEDEWEFGGVRHLAIHGHQFDRFSVNNIAVGRALTALYLKLQQIDRGRCVGPLLDRLDTHWLRLTDKVAKGALAHARARNAQRIFCGHTHEVLRLERDNIEYVNTGCWTQPSPTDVTVNMEGVQIHEVDKRVDYSNSGQERREDDRDFVDVA